MVGILTALLLGGCMSKEVGVCLEYMENGHGNVVGSAGPWGEVVDVNMSGPARFSKVPKDATMHPCPARVQPK
jgi:hypothetical protein